MVGLLLCMFEVPQRQQLASEDSVPETPSYGTEYACRAQKGFLGYATHFLKPAEQPTLQTVDSLLPNRTQLQCAERSPATLNASSKVR